MTTIFENDDKKVYLLRNHQITYYKHIQIYIVGIDPTLFCTEEDMLKSLNIQKTIKLK